MKWKEPMFVGISVKIQIAIDKEAYLRLQLIYNVDIEYIIICFQS